MMNQEQTRNASSTKTTTPACVNWSSPSFPDVAINNEKNKPNDFCVINTCRTQTIYATNRIVKSSTSYVTAKSRSNFKIPKCDNGICNDDDVVQVPLQLFDEVDQKAPMINLHRGFVTDVLQQVVHLIQHYARLVDRLGLILGPIHDRDKDGIGDTLTQSQPTDLFVILFYCTQWASSPDPLKCAQPEMTNTLSFVFPNQPQDDNCLTRLAYFEQNTVRLRDVELLTGLRWFRDGDPLVSQWERVRVNDRLWQLDKKNNQYGDDV